MNQRQPTVDPDKQRLRDIRKQFAASHEETRQSAIIRFNCSDAFDKAFIYFLYKDNKIVYVGETEGLFQRMSQHFNDVTKDFDRFEAEPFDGSRAQRLHKEKCLIRRFLPLYNTKHKNKVEIQLVLNK